MKYFCCDEYRRVLLKGHPFLNGIDFLEVVDDKNDPPEQRQTRLILHFINPLAPGSLQAKNIIIKGGSRKPNIKVSRIDWTIPGSPPLSPLSPPSSPPDDDSDRILLVTVQEAGDFSIYTLRLVADQNGDGPPAGFDPILSSLEFSFKVLCPGEFDCKPQHICEASQESGPEISYLAKDYASFRQLMLDRMALLVPRWKERNPADLGIMLIELLAYAGDYLSYRQDAIATEAYLGTARKRSSIRKHARLVDYLMHDGCNARTWAHIEVKEHIHDHPLVAEANGEKTKCLTRGDGLPVVFDTTSKAFETARQQDLQVFELLHDTILDAHHNEMHFYTWLNDDCCLPKGSTSATLDGDLRALRVGQVLIFAEVAGPVTGEPGDADPLHRHPVVLTKVELTDDPIGNPLQSPLDYEPRIVTNISWHASDALPFPLCISSTSADGRKIMVSVAYGNNVLVDHGLTVRELLPQVPESTVAQPGLGLTDSSSGPCTKATPVQVPVRYRPSLKGSPLTQAAPYDQKNPPVSAAAARLWTMREPLPAIFLRQDGLPGKWLPQRDLLNSRHNDEHFVVEIESEGLASLRFGNDLEGQRPEPGTVFTATYRIGNGPAGNIGSQALAHLVSNAPGITTDSIEKIWNPLPATGGMVQESIPEVRAKAPIAFRRQERAVTLADYEEMSRRCSTDIQRSTASLRWTGSWRTVFLTVDRLRGDDIDAAFERQLRLCLEKYRMAGQDLEVDSPRFVSLEIDMTVCVKAAYFKTDVRAALLRVLGNTELPNGALGIFHPDNFSFGQPVYLSAIYAAVQQTDGVASVRITKFGRQGTNDTTALDSGKLSLSRLEIARLDNDRNFPENGVLRLDMQGGK